MFGFNKKSSNIKNDMSLEEAEKYYQEALDKIRDKKEEIEKQESEEEKINKFYIGLLKRNLNHLSDDILRMMIAQAMYANCYELFLNNVSKNWCFEKQFTLSWDESNLASSNVKLVIEKFDKYKRELKNRFSHYIIEACSEIIKEREEKQYIKDMKDLMNDFE
jgi:transcription termination factor NusB